MMDDARLFRRTDPDFPVTRAAQQRLIAAGRVESAGPLAPRLLAGRCLIQGSSGAGKSMTLRHLVEEAHDYLTTMIIDPEGEFDGLAEHIGAASLRASEIAPDGLTAAASRAR